MMDDFQSETDSDYTSYWRDWVSLALHPCGLVFVLRVHVVGLCVFWKTGAITRGSVGRTRGCRDQPNGGLPLDGRCHKLQRLGGYRYSRSC
jgi:hypothetical protein